MRRPATPHHLPGIVPLAAPDPEKYAAARAHSDAQAKPVGAFGRLEELGAWVSACQGCFPPRQLEDVRVVVFAGDHGVARYGVSAYPPAVTTAIVQAALTGRAGINALAGPHRVTVRVHDLSCAEDLVLDPGTRERHPEVSTYKVCHGSEPFHLQDALTPQQLQDALAAGDAIAAREIADGAQLLIAGDIGIGNTTPAAALIAATHHVPAATVTGRGTGIDDEGLARKTEIIEQGIARIGARNDDPAQRLAALGGADLAAATGFMMGAARRGVPVLIDGVIAAAEATLAEALQPGTVAWMRAGHLSPEPGCGFALKQLGLAPVVDLGMRLGEGSGAVCAVPLLRTAVAALHDLALLSELTAVAHPDHRPDSAP